MPPFYTGVGQPPTRLDPNIPIEIQWTERYDSQRPGVVSEYGLKFGSFKYVYIVYIYNRMYIFVPISPFICLVLNQEKPIKEPVQC
jgi:hypothetical protein